MQPTKMNFITTLGIKHAGDIENLIKSLVFAPHSTSPLIGQINI
jgi:hypothetical protein